MQRQHQHRLHHRVTLCRSQQIWLVWLALNTRQAPHSSRKSHLLMIWTKHDGNTNFIPPKSYGHLIVEALYQASSNQLSGYMMYQYSIARYKIFTGNENPTYGAIRNQLTESLVFVITCKSCRKGKGNNWTFHKCAKHNLQDKPYNEIKAELWRLVKTQRQAIQATVRADGAATCQHVSRSDRTSCNSRSKSTLPARAT